MTQFNIKMSKEEKKIIFDKAAKVGMAAGTYMKVMALHGDIAVVAGKGMKE